MSPSVRRLALRRRPGRRAGREQRPGGRSLATSISLLCVVMVATLLPTPAPAHLVARSVPADRATGDPYAPGHGSGAYDVRHYHLRLRYHARPDRLEGRAHLRARATREVSHFGLDLRLRATAVRVDGRRARFVQHGGKVRVRPAKPLARGDRFTVFVSYRGRPGSFPSSGPDRWQDTADGAWVSGFTEHAARWYPANNRPSDKARYVIQIDARAGRTVLSNGRLVERRNLPGGWQRTRWSMRRPMAPYLAFIAIGDFQTLRGRSRAGVPFQVAVSKRLPWSVRRRAMAALRITPRIVDAFARIFGRYPFGTTGGVVVNAPRDYFYATEMQSLPLYSSSYFRSPADQRQLIAHELAHQWFGDSITVRRYRHLWLSEGFAVWASWYWEERRGGLSAAARFEETFEATAPSPELWRDPVTRPRQLLSFATYARPAMAVQALRQRLGQRSFERVLRTWVRSKRYGVVDTRQFIRTAQRVSGQRLGGFFRHWLRDPRPPERTAENGFRPGAAS